MNLAQMIKDGCFKKPIKFFIKLSILTDSKVIEILANKRIVKLASTFDHDVCDLFYNKAGELELKTLPIHLVETGFMANRSEQNMISYLKVDVVFNDSMWESK